MARSKYWCLTVNSNESPFIHSDGWEEEWKSDRWSYIVAQPEIAPETKHLHVQAYVEYGGAQGVRFGQVQAWFPGVRIAQRRGTSEQAAVYCKKDDSWAGTWRFERGDMSVPAQGKRNDLELIRDLVKQNLSWVQIIDQVPGAIRYFKEIKMYRHALSELVPKPLPNIELRPWQVELWNLLDGPVEMRRIFWIWSPFSAVGKTTTMQGYMASRPSTVLSATMSLVNLMHAFEEATMRVIWFDLSRSDPIDATATDILEKLSNGGYVFSGKYESMQKYVSAHIVVTCNRPPPEDRLPQRCREYRIDAHGSRVEQMIAMQDLLGNDVPIGNWINPDFVIN